MEENNGCHYTVSIALPGSIIDNAQSLDLCTYLAGQIGRAAAVFNVDEIVVFDESIYELRGGNRNDKKNLRNNGNVRLARILQFLECPQYLRKSLFPMHKDLKYAGLLNPIDSPHHMRASDNVKYREGIVLEKTTQTGKSYANVGLRQGDITIDRQLKPGMRITVQMDTNNSGEQHKVVSPSVPRLISGIYWGYSVRMAPNLSSVLTQCPYNGGYDLTIGTSERGHSVDEFKAPLFKHAIIVFGGIHGLEKSMEADTTLNIDDPSFLFQHYLNTCPNQGSRTIRTEEAILITMSSLRPKLVSSGFQKAGS